MMAFTSPSMYTLVSSKFHPLSSSCCLLRHAPLQSNKRRSSSAKLSKSRSSNVCSSATFRSLRALGRDHCKPRSGYTWRIGEESPYRGYFGRSRDNVFYNLHNADRMETRAAESVIGPEAGRTLFMILAACGALGQLLEERTKWGCRVSAPLLAMGTGLLLSGIGVIPCSAPAYDMVFSTLLPLAAALTLLERDVWQGFSGAGSTVKAFLFGAFGTILGTFVSFKIMGRFLGPDGWKIASCLCSSYVGGSINYAATAQILGLSSGSLLAAGMAADNLAMAAYFGVIMLIPDDSVSDINVRSNIDGNPHLETERPADPTVESIAVSLAAAAVACTVGDTLAALLPSSFAGSGLAFMALVASLFNAVAGKLSGGTRGGSIPLFAGAQNMGQSLMLLFFAVVGCSTGVKQAMAGGWPLFLFINILILVHLSTILALGKFAKLPMRSILIASNANIGGPGTAAAMANSRSWPALVRPALLVGTLGYTVGTATGVLVGIHALQPMLKNFPLII